MPNDGKQPGSMLLVEETFDGQDDRFLDALRAVKNHKQLAGFTDRWKKDPRPWARQQVFAYLQLPLDRPGHQTVVKRLFKHAEESRDHELMAAFLVAFDRLVRRVRGRKWHYDWQTNQVWREEFLKTPRNAIPSKEYHVYTDWRGREQRVPVYVSPHARLFSYHTRYYLRRRAWRYFRHLGFGRPAEYPAAIARALAQYEDEDLAQGENILDSWGLLQTCFRYSDALDFGSSKIRVQEGHRLAELQPSPRFPELWSAPGSLSVLLDLLQAARSRLVQVWARELLKREHEQGLGELEPDVLLGLLDHPNPEVQQFGTELFEKSRRLSSLPLETWLELLETKNPTALATICEVMKRHVTGERLDLARCVELACAKSAPVARLGFDFLSSRRIVTSGDRAAIASLSEAQCAAVGKELTAWALKHLGEPQVYDRDVLTRFFDSLLAEARMASWDWLLDHPVGYDDAALWSRLFESPFDDIRLRLVEELERRLSVPGARPDNLTSLWCSVLLGVHRGGRQKRKAVAQVGAELQAEPAHAETLLPVLSVALRSIRAPERRAGLAAVVTAVERRPELENAVAEFLPELNLSPQEAVA